jgi:hypothetical protein
MINRLNVVYLGRRTTARFPDHLFSLAMESMSANQDDLSRALERALGGCVYERHGEYSASFIARSFLIVLVSHGIRMPFGHRASLALITDTFIGKSTH